MENDNLLIFVYSLHPVSALDNLVERRVLQLVEGKFCLLNLWLNLAVLSLRSPLANRKNLTIFAELRENKIAFFVKALQFLTKATAQCKRLNFNLQEEHIVAISHDFSEVGDTTNVLLKFSLGGRADRLVGPTLVVAHSLARAHLRH